MQNNYYPFDAKKGIALCGTRGWPVPGENSSGHDNKIYNRKLGRLQLSLDAAIKDGYKNLVVTLHYPPFYEENPNISDYVFLFHFQRLFGFQTC